MSQLVNIKTVRVNFKASGAQMANLWYDQEFEIEFLDFGNIDLSALMTREERCGRPFCTKPFASISIPVTFKEYNDNYDLFQYFDISEVFKIKTPKAQGEFAKKYYGVRQDSSRFHINNMLPIVWGGRSYVVAGILIQEARKLPFYSRTVAHPSSRFSGYFSVANSGDGISRKRTATDSNTLLRVFGEEPPPSPGSPDSDDDAGTAKKRHSGAAAVGSSSRGGGSQSSLSISVLVIDQIMIVFSDCSTRRYSCEVIMGVILNIIISIKI